MDLFDAIGSYGTWQKRVVVFFFCSHAVGMLQTLSLTFLAPNVEFWCIEPTPTDNQNSTRCEVQVSNSTTVPCTKWEYDASEFPNTLVSEWDLVCDRQWLVSLAKSVYMFGFLVAALIFGQMSDWIGRFPIVVMSYAFNIVCIFLSLLSSSYTMFVVLRFFQAFGRAGLSVVGVVLVMEVVGPKHRIQAGSTLQPGLAMGFIILAGIAWFVRPWFWLQLTIALWILPMGIAFRFVPESPRWLIVHGKKDRLQRLLAEAIVVNRKGLVVDVEDLTQVQIHEKDIHNKNTTSLYHLLKMPNMRSRAFIMFFIWMVTGFIYYGMSLNTNDIAGNPYINLFIAGATEIPVCALVYWSIVKAGRRRTLASFMFGGGAASIAMLAVPRSLPWLQMSFAMAGKFCAAGSFGVVYLYTSELFPTVVRSVSLGTCSVCARLGSILSPFVRELGLFVHSSVPIVLYGVLALTSGLLALLLPETKGTNLPDTMKEGEEFGQLDSPVNQLAEDPQQKYVMHPLLTQKTTEVNALDSRERVPSQPIAENI